MGVQKMNEKPPSVAEAANVHHFWVCLFISQRNAHITIQEYSFSSPVENTKNILFHNQDTFSVVRVSFCGHIFFLCSSVILFSRFHFISFLAHRLSVKPLVFCSFAF